MTITNKTVLKKMSSEIQEAMLQHGDEQKVREHVRSVKLLADLLLEDETSTQSSPGAVQEPTVEEIRKMMGAGSRPEPVQKENKETKVDHDEANGSSIFDF
ncbi:YwdI family protein [Halobacillus faecis]